MASDFCFYTTQARTAPHHPSAILVPLIVAGIAVGIAAIVLIVGSVRRAATVFVGSSLRSSGPQKLLPANHRLLFA